jgi:hypothetical protein
MLPVTALYATVYILGNPCALILPLKCIHSTCSPKPNILTEFRHALCYVSHTHPTFTLMTRTYASQTSSTLISLILAIAYATCGIVAGSFRPFTMAPLTHFSFLTALGRGGASLRNLADACDGRISHQGPSVSICRCERGIARTTSMFSSAGMGVSGVLVGFVNREEGGAYSSYYTH